MKKLASTGLFVCGLMISLVSCDSKNSGSVEQAQQANEEKFNDSEMEDQQVKSFASSKLPTLRQHHEQATQLKNKLDNRNNSL